MKSSHRIRRMQRLNRMRSRAVHLNLVSMIDVFAVLVFFLLLSTSLAADRLNKLGLDLPSPSIAQPPEDPQRTVTVTLRHNALELSDLQGAVITLPNRGAQRDLARLATQLIHIKRQHPGAQRIVLLTEADIPYETLVQVMDTARVLPPRVPPLTGTSRDLFPDIAIGDAPEAGAVP